MHDHKHMTSDMMHVCKWYKILDNSQKKITSSINISTNKTSNNVYFYQFLTHRYQELLRLIFDMYRICTHSNIASRRECIEWWNNIRVVFCWCECHFIWFCFTDYLSWCHVFDLDLRKHTIYERLLLIH